MQNSMTSDGFEPTIPVINWSQTHNLNGTTTGTDYSNAVQHRAIEGSFCGL